MEPLPDIRRARADLLGHVRRVVVRLRRAVADEVRDLDAGLAMLATVRHECYESLNQAQHEALVLAAASHLARRDFRGRSVQWSWNPRQGGGRDDPDLQGRVGEEVVASVEVTTSMSPQGLLDRRMATTLRKLARTPGKRFYYVRSAQMAQRARTKVEREGLDIDVRELPPRSGRPTQEEGA